MGKKTKENKDERESFAAKQAKEKRRNTLIAIGVLAGVAAIVGYSAYNFVNLGGSGPGSPEGAGPLGDEHEHASILVRIHTDKFDFSGPAYQIKSSWIHFEGQDGNTLHRHASGVTLGYLFDTLRISLTDQCFVFPDGKEFCTNDEYSIKFYINHNQVPDIRNYVLQEDDRILISYGDETPEQIEAQLVELDSQIILK
ncbi:MAG TPA: protein-disulfide isomerase [Nitrosopumilaceae archaeon]|nr:protein-disulfide isomerase [Nitrosopumilaceae archaeon]